MSTGQSHCRKPGSCQAGPTHPAYDATLNREYATASSPATRLRMAWLLGTSTLPPRWPHFFSEDSWSSKCTAGG